MGCQTDDEFEFNDDANAMGVLCREAPVEKKYAAKIYAVMPEEATDLKIGESQYENKQIGKWDIHNDKFLRFTRGGWGDYAVPQLSFSYELQGETVNRILQLDRPSTS